MGNSITSLTGAVIDPNFLNTQTGHSIANTQPYGGTAGMSGLYQGGGYLGGTMPYYPVPSNEMSFRKVKNGYIFRQGNDEYVVTDKEQVEKFLTMIGIG